jgi:hypothetical protein
VIDSVEVAKRKMPEAELTDALERRSLPFAEAVLWPAVGEMREFLQERTTTVVADLFNASAAACGKTLDVPSVKTLRSATKVGMVFDATNPAAVAWVKGHAAELVSSISDEVREALRQTLRESFVKQFPPAQTAGLLRSVVGLTPERAAQVRGLQERIMANAGKTVWAGDKKIRVPEKVTKEFARGKADAFAQRLLSDRAKSIARTETIRISNAGQQSLWLQAREKGLLTADDVREWLVTPDDRLCESCAAMGGMRAELNGTFEGDGEGPPLHPMCRCAQVLAKRGTTSAFAPLRGPEGLLQALADRPAGFLSSEAIATDRGAASKAFSSFGRRMSELKKVGVQCELKLAGGTDISLSSITARGRSEIAAVDTIMGTLDDAAYNVQFTAVDGTAIDSSLLNELGIGNGRNQYRISVEFAHLGTDGPLARAYAGDTIQYNLDWPGWQSRDAYLKAMKDGIKNGWWAGKPNQFRTLTHEIGHLQNYRVNPAMFRNAPRGWWEPFTSGDTTHFISMTGETLEDIQVFTSTEVSRYAATNPHEFVAEVWTQLNNGNSVSSAVMEMYQLYGGAPVKPLAAEVMEYAAKAGTAAPIVPIASVPTSVLSPGTVDMLTPTVPKPPTVVSPKPPVGAKPIPLGPVGDDIRKVLEMRAQGMSYEKIERAMGWAKGSGKCGAKAWNIVKKYGGA